MKCEQGAAVRFVIKSGWELAVIRGDRGQSSRDQSHVSQITVAS